MTFDVKKAYIGTPMDRPEYMIIRVKHIPQEIFYEYNVLQLVKNGFLYV